MAEHKGVLDRRAADVQHAVLKPQVLVGVDVVDDLERRRLRAA
jgi:hypothetical protein